MRANLKILKVAQLHVNVCANKDVFYTCSLPSVLLEKDLNKCPILDYSQRHNAGNEQTLCVSADELQQG